jgi:chromosome segregation ATPase
MFLDKVFKRKTASQKEKVNFMPTTSTDTQTEHTNLAADLRAAEAAYNAAATRKRVLDGQLANVIRANTTAEANWNSADRNFFPERFGAAVRSTRGQLAGLQSQLPDAEKALRESETALNRVRRQISDHPKRAAALGEQQELISKGVAIAKASWHAPLQNIRALVEEYNAIADHEYTFVTNANIGLREIGLPEIRARLDGSRHALPLDIFNIDIARLARDAAVAIEQLQK